MNSENLNSTQLARCEALAVAHGLLAGTEASSIVMKGKRDGLLSYELPHVVSVSEYVLTGDYIYAGDVLAQDEAANKDKEEGC